MINFDIINKAIEDCDINKNSIKNQSNAIIDVVKNGEESALRVRLELRAIQAVVEDAMSRLTEESYRDAQKYEEKEFKYMG